jgi:predicted DNA-binding transcriptional regulator AlpA
MTVAELPAPAPMTILTRAQVCAWLQISERQFYKLNIPALRVGKRAVRYQAATVLEFFMRRSAP